jgi:hypothetical protein
MKKVIFVLMLAMSVVAVNAQMDTTKTKMKSMGTSVSVTSLPKAVTDNIAKEYPGYTVKEATSAMENSAMVYHVVVTKGTATETLVYDKAGKFLKKLPK